MTLLRSRHITIYIIIHAHVVQIQVIAYVMKRKNPPSSFKYNIHAVLI